MLLRLLTFVLALAAWLPSAVASETEFTVATFSVEATIPIGHRCMGVLPTKSIRVLDPLFVHGLVLRGPELPIVLVAVDWCEIRNASYDQWRSTLATACGTTQQRVLVAALHQHDAPVIDASAEALLREVGLGGELFDERFHDEVLRRVAQALKDSLATPQVVTHIGLGQAEVVGIASNRRVVTANGHVTFRRGSRSGGDPILREAPVGVIDPQLKTLSFWSGSRPLVALHSYATHPMSFYGKGEVSADFVGLARARRQRDDASIKQIYFSGCSGDVTAGKYNDGSPDARVELIDKLYRGMVNAWQNTRRMPLEQVQFRNAKLDLEFHPGEDLTASSLESRLRNPALTVEKRILAAMGLASRRRVASGHKIDMPCVDLGAAQVLLFPGESFVGYQLRAQQIKPDDFIFSIGYGECWPGYIPTERAFEDAFEDSWLWVAPGSEQRMLRAMRAALQAAAES